MSKSARNVYRLPQSIRRDVIKADLSNLNTFYKGVGR